MEALTASKRFCLSVSKQPRAVISDSYPQGHRLNKRKQKRWVTPVQISNLRPTQKGGDAFFDSQFLKGCQALDVDGGSWGVDFSRHAEGVLQSQGLLPVCAVTAWRANYYTSHKQTWPHTHQSLHKRYLQSPKQANLCLYCLGCYDMGFLANRHSVQKCQHHSILPDDVGQLTSRSSTAPLEQQSAHVCSGENVCPASSFKANMQCIFQERRFHMTKPFLRIFKRLGLQQSSNSNGKD